MLHDSYKTIKTTVEAEIKEKGSRFICRAKPVSTREDAENYITSISQKYYDATHHCYAYNIGCGENNIIRFNDDGEPSGTAGKPILQAIESRQLTDIVVVVTRYFGGTKLGTGGLVRAYGGAVMLALDQAEIKIEYLKTHVDILYNYQFSNLVRTLINKFKADIEATDYGELVSQKIWIRNSQTNNFVNQLTDLSSGNVQININN
ncbi:YigZ family protein [candidate division KSB1 bacterium]|nr:YigZ family protein [candidate division KSB1 bacterium]